MMNITHMNPGSRGTIVRIDGDAVLQQRLMDMGFMPHALLMIERNAPLGFPVWVVCNGTHLTLRRAEAEAIEVAPI